MLLNSFVSLVITSVLQQASLFLMSFKRVFMIEQSERPMISVVTFPAIYRYFANFDGLKRMNIAPAHAHTLNIKIVISG